MKCKTEVTIGKGGIKVELHGDVGGVLCEECGKSLVGVERTVCCVCDPHRVERDYLSRWWVRED